MNSDKGDGVEAPKGASRSGVEAPSISKNKNGSITEDPAAGSPASAETPNDGKRRRSFRKSRTSNLFKNFHLESDSEGEEKSTAKKRKYQDDDDYQPDKVVSSKMPKKEKSNRGRKPRSSVPDESAATGGPLPQEARAPSPAQSCPELRDPRAPPASMSSSLSTQSAKKKVTAKKTTAGAFTPIRISKTIGDVVTLPDISNPDGEIKISSVKSLSRLNKQSSSPAKQTAPTIQSYDLTSQQRDEARALFGDSMDRIDELSRKVAQQVSDFLTEKVNSDFLNDSDNLQSGVRDTFSILKFAKESLTSLEENFRGALAKYTRQNKLQNYLKSDIFLPKLNCSDITVTAVNKAKVEDSDSDCEIVEEDFPVSSSTELSILRKVERNGISWRSTSGSIVHRESRGGVPGQEIQLPGSNSVWINDNIKIKKVQSESNDRSNTFFCKDGRTLKPPDRKYYASFVNRTGFGRIKELCKRTLVLGWLDLAGTNVNRNLFSVIKELESCHRRNDSCSDLGESCSDSEGGDLYLTENNLLQEIDSDNTPLKLENAFRDLLKTSSESEGDEEIPFPKKKMFRKKKTSNVYTTLIENEDNNFKSIDIDYNDLLVDPKFNWGCFVKIHRLSPDDLKPYEDYLSEIMQLDEMEKLLNLSTLSYTSNRSTNAIKSTEIQVSNVKPKLVPKQKASEYTLLDMLGAEKEYEGDNKILFDNKKGEEKTFEQMASEYAINSNMRARDILANTSSSEDNYTSDSSLNSQGSVNRNSKSKSPKRSPLKKTTTNSLSSDSDHHSITGDILLDKTSPLHEEATNKNHKSLLCRNILKQLMKEEVTEIDSEEEEKRFIKLRNKPNKPKYLDPSTTDEDDDDDEDDDKSIIEEKPSVPASTNNIKFTSKNVTLYIDSSESDDEAPTRECQDDAAITAETPTKGRRNIRKMINDNFLVVTTKQAAIEEGDRLQRLNAKKILTEEMRKNLNNDSFDDVLEFDSSGTKPLLALHPKLTKVMKSHQIEGVKFMWDTCFESVDMVRQGAPGGGCIVAHCMGLGKTLQVVALLHTLLLAPSLPFRTVLICCPLSTILNWVEEFDKWLRNIDGGKDIKIYEMSKYKKNYQRGFQLADWQKSGGVLILGYEMFRHLSTFKPRKTSMKSRDLEKIQAALLDPGPDIVVCDEGHLLKNDNTALAKAMNRISTRRRILLTGTPLQNNLKEYFCMVNFVKPNLLGTQKEYYNRFENPITNGQHRDSNYHDIKIMKKRSHVLHKMLEGCVHRKEVSVLAPYLPTKREYVLFTTLSDCQAKLYQHYLDNFAQKSIGGKATLLKDYHFLQKIWTHPRVLQDFFLKSQDSNKLSSRKTTKPFLMNKSWGDSDDDVICIEDGLMAEPEEAEQTDGAWWLAFVNQSLLDSVATSHKFSVVFSILDECIQIGDKLLIFCTSLFTINTLEYFLGKRKGWKLGNQYFRLDGSVSLENRQKNCKKFNSKNNDTVKLYLISTRAGGLGLNMVAANRVIIFDVSWNPSHDIQSIFRIYRFGQKKDCYIYRIVSVGTMEEKMYERSVTKQAIACRVVDEQQIDRHYNTAELSELYTFTQMNPEDRPVPVLPSDGVLAGVLARGGAAVWSVHQHDSLLRDMHEEQLDEDDRIAAWREYEAEKTAIITDKTQPSFIKSAMPSMSTINHVNHFNFSSDVAYPVGPIINNMSNIHKQQVQNNLDMNSIFPNSDTHNLILNNQTYNNIHPNKVPGIQQNNTWSHTNLIPSFIKKYGNVYFNNKNPICAKDVSHDAFQNVKITDIKGCSNPVRLQRKGINIDNKKNDRKLPFSETQRSVSSNLVNDTELSNFLDLTSLPDTPDKKQNTGKSPKSARKSSGKSKRKTPRKTPRKGSPSKRSENNKKSASKKLSFLNDTMAKSPFPNTPMETKGVSTIELD